MARPTPPPPPPSTTDDAAAGAAGAGARADAARAAAERFSRLAIARRSEPRFAAAAGILRLRQLRGERRRPRAVLQANAGGAEEISDVGDHRSKATATSAERRSIIWRLGERRAVAARAYLMSLGIDANRLRTVSYGSEFPFDPATRKRAWSRNRRAHFVITAK